MQLLLTGCGCGGGTATATDAQPRYVARFQRPMPRNHLEDLVAEWYEFRGYIVRRNVAVGKRPKGGYECELDIVAFHPELRHLVHLEPSLDALPWPKRQQRYAKKFTAGRRYIPSLFPGFALPQDIEQIAILLFASRATHDTVGGGKLLLVGELLEDIFRALRGKRVASSAIPEHLPILRSFQFVGEYWEHVCVGLGRTPSAVREASATAANRHRK